MRRHIEFIVILLIITTACAYCLTYLESVSESKRGCNHDNQEDWIVVDKMPDANHRGVSIFWYHLNGADHQFTDSSDFYYVGDFLLADSVD